MAQLGNVNAMKNGHRSKRPGTVLAHLGRRYNQAYRDVLRLRKGVERTLRRSHSELTLLQGAKIQSICRLELNCRIAELTIRDRADITVEELRSHRESIGRWTRERDGLLAKLLGDAGDAASDDPWAVLDQSRREALQPRQSVPEAADGPAVAEVAENASSDATRSEEGTQA